MNKNMPVVILAGGLGTRLREETEFRPKPMVPIGGKPIIWHIMKIYSYYGFNRFIICLGYKGNMIKDYFLQYRFHDVDMTVNTLTGHITKHDIKKEEWDITLVDTGQNSQTGSRIAQIAPYVTTENFLLTYGDGLSTIDINSLVAFHTQHKKLVTLSAVCPPLRFGNLTIKDDMVLSFQEKQKNLKEWVNGGFFVCNKKIFDYCSSSEQCIFEKDVLPVISKNEELMAYKHDGFWYCMDTIRDTVYLNNLWYTRAPWKVWENQHDTYNSAMIVKDWSQHEKI